MIQCHDDHHNATEYINGFDPFFITDEYCLQYAGFN
jgi:hypothetical protein